VALFWEVLVNLGGETYLKDLGHWRHVFEGYAWSLAPSLLSASQPNEAKNLFFHAPTTMVIPQVHKAKLQRTEPSETMSHNESFLF
jgi:hypothetical protein